ncbi:hypothetical protein Bca4012_099148 [Brassica carinata]
MRIDDLRSSRIRVRRELNQPGPDTDKTRYVSCVPRVAATRLFFELNSGGCVGWGEAPILLSVTAEDHITAMVKTREACELLRELPEMKLGHVLQEIGGILPGHRFASVKSETFSSFFA